MLKENEVYVIQFDYSTEDTDGIDLYLFRNFDTAFAKFKSIIKDEIKFYTESYSHLEEDFELDTNIDDNNALEYYWNYKYKHDYYVHTFLDLKIKEIQ